MTTLIEPFIFNKVATDIKRFINEEQEQALIDDMSFHVPDKEVTRDDFYEGLYLHLSFVNSLLSVRFNEHASLDKAANLGVTKYIEGYASLFDNLEHDAPRLFNLEQGYVIANTKEAEAYFESLAYKDIEDITTAVCAHLHSLGHEYLENGKEYDSKVYQALAKNLKSLQRYAHAKSGLALDPYPNFKPKRDVDYSFV